MAVKGARGPRMGHGRVIRARVPVSRMLEKLLWAPKRDQPYLSRAAGLSFQNGRVPRRHA